MKSRLLNALLDAPFELTPRPDPVPGDLRLAWGLALLVLILGTSRGQRASLQKLHFLAHSARTASTRDAARRVFSRAARPGDFLVRVEPSLNRAIAWAKGARLVDFERGRTLKLTGEGRAAFHVLNSAENILAEEKAFIESIARLATERSIEKIMRMEPTL